MRGSYGPRQVPLLVGERTPTPPLAQRGARARDQEAIGYLWELPRRLVALLMHRTLQLSQRARQSLKVAVDRSLALLQPLQR